MTTPIYPSSSNSYGIGAGNQTLGRQALINAGVQVGGSMVTPTAGMDLLGAKTVYMGTKKADTPKLGPGPYAPGYQPKTNTFMGSVAIREDYNSVISQPLKWMRDDPKKLKELVNKGIMNKIPGFDQDMGIPEIMDAWKRIVDASVEFTDNSGTDWSPMDVMDTYQKKAGEFGTKRVGDFIVDVATGERIKYVGPMKKTTTSKRVNLSSAEDVKALTMQMLRELLGRNPTTEEVAAYKTSINTMEQATPEVTTTTSVLSPNLATGEVETVSQDSVTSGGVSQAAMQASIEESAMADPEYAKYQGGTTYFNALLQLIGGGF